MSKFNHFIRNYWQYYRELEDELLATRKCVDFYKENYKTFSVEYLKLFQAVCGEIDVLGKSMAAELNPTFKSKETKNNILKWWYVLRNNYFFYKDISKKDRPEDLVDVEVTFVNDEEIKPWSDFEVEPFIDKKGASRIRHKDGGKTPLWWKDYTDVKHSRTLPIENNPRETNYYKANLGNTISAFAVLYVLEKTYMAHIGTRNEREGFADRSLLFERVLLATTDEINETIANTFL